MSTLEIRWPLALATVAFAVALAAAQSSEPAAFVANYGNLRGGVTSYLFEPNGHPTFVQELVTGEKESISDPELGTNAYAIDISPSGRFLATSHATASDTFEQITIIEVASDATLTIYDEFLTPDSPLDLIWLDEAHLAVLRTSVSDFNYVILYEFDATAHTLTELDRHITGTFTSSLIKHPTLPLIYIGDSNQFWLRAYRIDYSNTADEIQLLQTLPSTDGLYPLNITMNADGTRIYAGGGISGGRNKIHAYDLDANGLMSPSFGSPYITSGNSPFDFAFSPDGHIMWVGHGTDATVRSFLLDPNTGYATETGFVFDVGLQGTVGDLATLGDRLLVTDDWDVIDDIDGLYAFTYDVDGSFVPIGGAVASQGVWPTALVAWNPQVSCPADIDHSGLVDLADLATLIAAFGTCDGDATFNAAADIAVNGCIDLADLASLLAAYGGACPN
ncbi:MAG: beta-propeller fold lactonase family protein [Phycisphaerales bacterium]|nr:beta-propeller fold lactonase family protein [Phycisphaerales bacterium]